MERFMRNRQTSLRVSHLAILLAGLSFAGYAPAYAQNDNQDLPSSMLMLGANGPISGPTTPVSQTSTAAASGGGGAMMAPPSNQASSPIPVQQGLMPPVTNNAGQTDVPNFYEPPEAADPVQPPTMIVESSQDAQDNQGKPAAPPLPPGVSGVDFAAALAQKLPMTPQEIYAYRQLRNQVNIAQVMPLGPAPAPVSRSVMMSMSTGQAAPVIHLYGNNATSMTFADDTGAPWPIESVIIGDKTSYTVDYDKTQAGSNILVISPLKDHADLSNMIVTLRGSPSPLIFSLETGTDKIDYRVDVNLEAPGPNAIAAVEPTSTLAPTDDTLMQQFVDDVPPPHARQLKTSSADVEAWSYQGDYFLRTDKALMGLNTGGPVDIANSVSQIHVYRISPTPTVTMSDNGNLEIVTITDDYGVPTAQDSNFPDEGSGGFGQ
jgi:intracellular multiplication protein IcmK